MFGINTVTAVPYDISLSGCPTLRAARLYYVRGKGRLDKLTYADKETFLLDDTVTLDGIPLAESLSEDYEESLLKAGAGIENVPAYGRLSEIFGRAGNASIDDIGELTPLLGLLSRGLYIIAEAECFPTNGNGFFWSVSEGDDGMALPVSFYESLTERYYEYTPAYLFPTKSPGCFDKSRAERYVKLMESGEQLPLAVAYHMCGGVSLLLDGHHRACAAALLGRPLRCLLIIPHMWFSYRNLNGIAIRDKMFFSNICIPVSGIAPKYIPLNKRYSEKRTENSAPMKPRVWEEKYLSSAAKFPSSDEYMAMLSTEIPPDGSVSDEVIELCFANLAVPRTRYPDYVDESTYRMYAIMLSLKFRGDHKRLRSAALQCVDSPNSFLRKQAYIMLAGIKGDEEIEQHFIDYIVECEDKTDPILKIVNSYWS